jgi:hypothetical protein
MSHRRLAEMRQANHRRDARYGYVYGGADRHRFYLRQVLPLEKRAHWAALKRRMPLHRILLANERRGNRPESCPFVIATSRLGRDGIVKYSPMPPERVVVAHNEVDAARLSPEAQGRYRDAVRAHLGVVPDGVAALFVRGGSSEGHRTVEVLRRPRVCTRRGKARPGHVGLVGAAVWGESVCRLGG